MLPVLKQRAGINQYRNVPRGAKAIDDERVSIDEYQVIDGDDCEEV
jgi:hypothetical protein